MDDKITPFENFLRIIATLRSPNGCPWDRAQTHLSLKPYLIEEAYEVIEAIDEGNAGKLCGELGDLLLQIGLHSNIAAQEGKFEIDDVLIGINEKLIRRHPHVFGDVEVSGQEEVALNWESIKSEEGLIRESVLDGVPTNIPALAHSQLLQQRAARVGFDWDAIDGVLEKVSEELEELRQARTHQERVHEFGDLVMSLANAARWMQIDLEAALRLANSRFRDRFMCMEKMSRERGFSMNDLTLVELDALWEEAKLIVHGDSEPD